MINTKKFLLLFVAIFALCSELSAREVISINDNWKFYFSSENSADYARTISLPHTWAYGSANALVTTQPTTANYIREIYVPNSWSAKRIFVKFYGVESVADILVNGTYVGEHRGGSTAFTLEITDFVKANASNRIHVIVNNSPQSNVLPTSHEEDRYGGIYRDVEIIVTDPTTISPLYFGSDGIFVEQSSVSKEAVKGEVKVHLSSKSDNNCSLSLSIIDKNEKIVFHKSVAKVKISSDPASIPYELTSPYLWSPEQPDLYKFVVNVSADNSSDVVTVSSGFRSIDYSERGAIHINGVATPFNSVALYHDYPHVGGAASARDIERDMEFVKELGANAIRSATHPHHPHLYDLCDEQGTLVWIDLPLVKAPFLSDIAYYPTAGFHQNGRETLTEIIAQNYNHPSVVMWGIFSLLNPKGNNPIPYITELNKLAKSLDSSRPTVAVSDQDGDINSITDLVVWKQTLGWERGLFSDIDVWSNLLHSKWSSMRSAVIYGQSGRYDQQAEPKNFKSSNANSASTWLPEGRQREFNEEYAQRLLPDTLFWGVCLNSLFDFRSARNPLGENNTGLVSFDRRNRKDIFYLYKANWNKEEATLHIADKRNKITSEPLYTLSVYASDTLPVTLFTPKGTLEMKRTAPWHCVESDISLNDGPNTLVVRQGELSDSIVVVLQGTTPSTSSRSRSSLLR